MDPRTEKMLADRRPQAAPAGPVQTWLRAHWGLASIAATLLIVAVLGGRHLFVTLPAAEREQAALEQQRARQTMEVEFDANQASLEACLVAADAERKSLWDAACRARKQKSGCGLLRDVAEQHQRAHTDRRADCLKRFSLGTAQP